MYLAVTVAVEESSPPVYAAGAHLLEAALPLATSPPVQQGAALQLSQPGTAGAAADPVWGKFTRAAHTLFRGPALTGSSGEIVESEEECATLCLDDRDCYFWSW